MDFSDPGMSAALDAWASDADLHIRAEGHNIRFEERLDRARLNAVEATVAGPVASADERRGERIDFVQTPCELPVPNVPPTFPAITAGDRMRRLMGT